MKTALLFTILITTSLFATTDKTLEKTPSESNNVISSIQKHYQNLNSFQATFKQTFFHKAYKKRKHSHGSVIFKQKLKMKWHYQQPEEKFIISDGVTFWIYEPENEQVFKASVKQSELKEAIALLFGAKDLFKKYTISVIQRAEKTEKLPAGITLELTPKAKEPRYRKVTLFLNEKYDIQATETVDQLGNINTIYYQNLQFNQELKDDLFQFTVPKDVEVIEQDK